MVPPFRPRGLSGTDRAKQAWRVTAVRAADTASALLVAAGRLLLWAGLIRPESTMTRTRLLWRNLMLAALLLAWRVFQAVVLRW